MGVDTEDLKHVPLHDLHVERGGSMTPFAGYEMPVKYRSIREEHHAVRQQAGLFDVSHMGRVEVRGEEAIDAVDRLMTHHVGGLNVGQARYTVMCNEQGGIIDDLVIYRLGEDRLLLCINAANRKRDLAHLRAQLGDGAVIDDQSDSTVQLALQGPEAEAVLQGFCGQDLSELRFFRSTEVDLLGGKGLVARTGYTGEDGFELYLGEELGRDVAEALLAHESVQLCGLGCRDTLRMEAGLLLHGQDMTEETNPLEAGLGWLVKFGKGPAFVGQSVLEGVAEKGVEREMTGFRLEGRGILRAGYAIEVEGQEIGHLTSGGVAPTLEASIGLGYIDSAYGDVDEVEVVIRGRKCPARVVDLPFYTRDN